jgi:hypothetical protein
MVEAWNRVEDMILRGAPLLAIACTAENALKPVVDATIATTFLELAASTSKKRNCLPIPCH